MSRTLDSVPTPGEPVALPRRLRLRGKRSLSAAVSAAVVSPAPTVLDQLRKRSRCAPAISKSFCADNSLSAALPAACAPTFDNPATTSVCNTWVDVAAWPSHYVACSSRDAMTDTRDQLATFCEGVTHAATCSSAFSGVCADTVADNCFYANLMPVARSLGVTPPPKPIHVATVDYAVQCQYEHMALPCDPRP